MLEEKKMNIKNSRFDYMRFEHLNRYGDVKNRR